MALGELVKTGLKIGGAFISADEVGSAISTTIDSSVRGIQTLRQKNVTVRCIGCHAPISGLSGTKCHCQYCDTEQTLSL